MFREQKGIKALPEHQLQDHKIKLKEGAELLFCPLYKMSDDKLRTLKEYVDKYLKKGYIKELKSLARAPTLFTPKADGMPRWIIDYQRLNDITIKDYYTLLLVD